MRDELLRRTTSEAVAGWLRNEILRGELQPGARLRQNDIAARLGVSTTPVREAFAQLQAEGLLRIDPHRSAIVFRPTIEDLTESYEIREVLEQLAVAKAIPNLRDELLDELQSLVDEMRKVEDTRRWVELNDRFHMILYEPSGLPRLCHMIEQLRDASAAYIFMFVAAQSKRDGTTDADDEHQKILDACRVRDGSKARKAVQAHLRHTSSKVMEFLEHREGVHAAQSST